jgi:hypothetical protein
MKQSTSEILIKKNININYSNVVPTSYLNYGDSGNYVVGIAIVPDPDKNFVTLHVSDSYDKYIGINHDTSINISPSDTLKLIDALYKALGTIETGEIIEGEFYPDEEQFEEA